MKVSPLTVNSLAALIEPVDRDTGYLTCLGLDDPNKRGVFHYNIRDQSRPLLDKINPKENSRDHVLALAWAKNHSVLFIHDSSGNVLQYDK